MAGINRGAWVSAPGPRRRLGLGGASERLEPENY